MEDKRLHLDFIQRIIARMANNLFYLKGWTITLIAALFALFVKDANSKFLVLAYFPVIICWTLDGYFLSQERLFRALYDHVRKLDNEKIDFSMDTSKYKNKSNSWSSSMKSPTLLIFYIPLLIIMAAIIDLPSFFFLNFDCS